MKNRKSYPIPEGPLFIYGAGGHSKVLIDILQLRGGNIAMVLDDDPEKTHREIMGIPVYYAPEALQTMKKDGIHAGVIGVGDNRLREKLAAKVEELGYSLITVVHPESTIAEGVEIGEGTVIMAGVVINSETRIGRNVILNTSCSIDHDCSIEDGVHISPGVHFGGGVHVGTRGHVGIGAAILPHLHIGHDSIVGSGAVVTKDVPAQVTVVGVPAHILKEERDKNTGQPST